MRRFDCEAMRRKAWGVAELADIGITPFTADVTVGGTTTNSLEVFGDHDWFSINLFAGQAITVTLNGVTLVDPYLRNPRFRRQRTLLR